MKKLLTLIIVVLFTISTFSQVPGTVSYQAVVRNTGGELVKNSPVGIKLTVLQTTQNGTIVYCETQTPTSNVNGLISLEIGNGTPVPGPYPPIDWANGPYFLKTDIDPLGGTNYTISGVSQILSVPYAIYAQTAATATNAVKITGDQTVADHKTFTGTITVPAPVNQTDAATKSYIDNNINNLFSIIQTIQNGVKDFDGNSYKAILIGTQVWMASNLMTTKYNDGSSIPLVEDNASWSGLTTPGYCWYSNNQTTYGNTYGALYNWYTVNSGKLCPAGWHMPSNTEWLTLIWYLGGPSVAGGKLKETGTLHWASSNIATNESGFTALPGGDRSSGGTFEQITLYGHWWTATAHESDPSLAYGQALRNGGADALGVSGSKKTGFSVRCIKD